MKVEERLLKYVSCWTTSEESKEQIPSNDREFVLAKMLETELRELGLTQVILTDHCYVYALLPATPGRETDRAVGFISHMDTSPDYSGENVKPQIIPDYDGGDILLNGANIYLKVSDFPSLASLKGRTLITTDGTTLLGADDKAGIAEIMTALEELIAGKTPHGDIWIGFTPDEEVGRGADLFDLNYFKADYAYTVDGGYEGEIAYENFNAATAIFTIHGVNVHPGEAKDIMVNALLVGCDIVSQLPALETPAHTAGREGFFHLTDMSGDVSSAALSLLVRDHDPHHFESRLNLLRTIEVEINQKYGAGTAKLEINYSYENMLSVIEEHMYVVDLAKQAISSIGLQPVSHPIRGGTDGGRLSFMGLPCPNLGTGGYAFHGPYEHISVEGMETAVRIIRQIMASNT
ncbi:MAG: peptidase T [Muribaculaceae bacterium]|nr:peptidase T [Roseburia sp.]MCM1432202.1 peptidase T [Muribaculaceae bacterium]MCM1493931.1 peptidase T [Muribaculaceae bacterium]